MRVAGLRAASVFMARFENENKSLLAAGFPGGPERRRTQGADAGVGTANMDTLDNDMGVKGE